MTKNMFEFVLVHNQGINLNIKYSLNFIGRVSKDHPLDDTIRIKENMWGKKQKNASHEEKGKLVIVTHEPTYMKTGKGINKFFVEEREGERMLVWTRDIIDGDGDVHAHVELLFSQDDFTPRK